MARLGMVLYHGIEHGSQLKAYAELAEAAGFESLWVTERYFHEETFALLGFSPRRHAPSNSAWGSRIRIHGTQRCWRWRAPPWTASVMAVLSWDSEK